MGFAIKRTSKVYPISELKKVTEITDNLGSVDIVIQYNPDNNQIDGTNKTTNEKLKFQKHWWLGWKEFHSDTEIWKEEKNSL